MTVNENDLIPTNIDPDVPDVESGDVGDGDGAEHVIEDTDDRL